MDTAAIEAAGTAPLKPYLARDRRRQDPRAARRAVRQARLRQPGRPRHRRRLQGPGPSIRRSPARRRLGLPEPRILSRRQRQDEGAPRRLSQLYRHHREARRPARRRSGADRIIALETALSKAQWTAADRRDIDKIYNPMTPRAADEAGAAVRLDRDAAPRRASAAPRRSSCTEPSAVAGAGKILASTPLSTWKEWLAFRFVSDHATCCPRRSTTRASPSIRRSCPAFSSSANAGSAALRRSTARSARASARSTSSRTTRPSPSGR